VLGVRFFPNQFQHWLLMCVYMNVWKRFIVLRIRTRTVFLVSMYPGYQQSPLIEIGNEEEGDSVWVTSWCNILNSIRLDGRWIKFCTERERERE